MRSWKLIIPYFWWLASC